MANDVLLYGCEMFWFCDEKFSTRCVKGVPFFNKRVSFSVKNGI